MIEAFVATLGLVLIGIVGVAVHHATRDGYLLTLRSKQELTEMLEEENQILRAELRRISAMLPPPPIAPVRVSVPPPPEIPRNPFVSRGSVIPPPPEYLFDLPKKVLSAPDFPKFPAMIPPPPTSWVPLPPPPPLPTLEDDENPPSTVRSLRSQLIAHSLRPPK